MTTRYKDTPRVKRALESIAKAMRHAGYTVGILDTQPLASLQWVDPAQLHANDYNPNHVAPPELALLKLSILENGWTQPIVARDDGEIVDGFHRWTLGSSDDDIRHITGGLVPVVRLNSDPATQRMATIRHNRARGQHGVVKMADIVAGLASDGLERDEIAERLGMQREEVNRLLDRGNMLEHGAGADWSKGWVPDGDSKP